MGLLTVNAAASGRRRSFRMQRRHSPSSVRDGFAELPSSRRGTPQSENSELTLTPKKKDRKWTLSGLFRRRKNKSSDTENSSSLEENTVDNNNKHKSSFLKRKLSLKKKPSGSRKVVGKFEFTKNTPSNENHQASLIISRDVQLSGNSSEKLSSLNSSSLSSKQKFDSLTLLQTGSSCGSLNSSGKRSLKNDVKARVEAEHEKLKDSSSDDEFAHARKYHSQDNINDSLKRRSRAARTERYLKRLNQINNLPFHQQAELLRMLDQNKVNIKHFVFQPQAHLKTQSANSSLTNSPMPNIKFTFSPGEINYTQNNLYVNLADARHDKLTKTYSKPSPLLPRHTLRQIDLNNSANPVDDQHIYMNVSSLNGMPPSKVPPMPPPRDPHRKVICTYSSPGCVNYQQRPVSYAFEAPKFTSVDNLASRSHPVTNLGCGNGNYRSNSEQHIGSGPIYSPTNDRPASVLQFTTDIDYLAAPTEYQYITDQKPRSRRPIQIECNEKQNNNETNNLKPNNRLYFSDQHINSYRFENGSSPRSTINSSEEQSRRVGGKLHQSDSPAASISECNRNAVTDSKAHFQFNKANKIDHNDLDHGSDHAPNPALYLSRRNSKEICQFVRPLSMVLEKSESEVESSKPDSRTSSSKTVPPDPPIRKNFSNANKKRAVSGTDGKTCDSPKTALKEFNLDSVNSVDIDELLEFNKQHNPSHNLEEALNELEEIYKSLQLSDDDLLDRAERRDVPAQLHAILSRDFESDSSCDEVDGPVRKRRERTRSLSTDRKKDDMAYRRIFKTDNPNFVPRLDPRNIMSQAGSFLLVSPTLAPPVFPNLSEPPMSPIPTNEPDVTYDDVVFRSIKHVNNSLKTLDPQPPFGIPVGPITQASSTDYLHAIPEDRYKPTFSSRKTPDVVKDDLAFRNLRKDLNHNPRDYRKKRAIRSLSANLSGVLSRAEKLKYSFPHPLSYARSSSFNDLPSECSKEYQTSLEPSLSQLYSSASTESLTDFDVREFLRHKTPTNYEDLLRKFNSNFESSVLNIKSCLVSDTAIENDDKAEESRTTAPDSELEKNEVKDLIKAIESNKLNKSSLQQKKISQHKPIVLSAFSPTLSNENGTKNVDGGLISSASDNETTKLNKCLLANSVEGYNVSNEKHNLSRDISAQESTLEAGDNFSRKSNSAISSAFVESRGGQVETPLKSKKCQEIENVGQSSERQVLMKTNNFSENEPKNRTPEVKKECPVQADSAGELKSSTVDAASSGGFSLEENLKVGNTSDYKPKPKVDTSSEVSKKRMSLVEDLEKFVERKQNSLFKDAPIRRRHSQSADTAEPDAELNSAKTSELKTRRHSKIEIPEKFRETNEDETSKDLKSNSSAEAHKKSTKSPKLKKKRASQIEIPEKFRESKENLASSDIVQETNSKCSPEKSKSAKSPKLKKKRISQIEIPEKFRESIDALASSNILAPETDLKSSGSLEYDTTSKSAKSPKSKKKRLNQIGVSEKFRKSMEHLASSYAVDQETDLKFSSSSSEDAKSKSAKSPKLKKKRPSPTESSANSRDSKESCTSKEILSGTDLKSTTNSERDSKVKSSKSQKVRRKRSISTDSPEKKRGSRENLAICDISAQETAPKPSDSPNHSSKTNSTKSPKLRRKRLSQIDIPENFQFPSENLLSTDSLPQEEDPKSADNSGEKKKRPSKIEIPEIFKESIKKSVSSDNLTRKASAASSGRSELDPTLKVTKCSEIKDDVPSQGLPVVNSASPPSVLSCDVKNVSDNSFKSSENEPQKIQPLKSILKKSDSNTDRASSQNRQCSLNKTAVPANVEKSAEDSGVVVEFNGESFLISDDNDNLITSATLENSKISGLETESDAGKPSSPFLKPEPSCLSEIDQNSVVTNSSVDQKQPEISNTDVEDILKKLEYSISSCGDFGDENQSALSEKIVSEGPSYKFDINSSPIPEKTDLVFAEKPSRGACFDDNAESNATHIGNGRVFTTTLNLETCSDIEPERNDKDEIVSALNELTSKMTSTVTDTSGDPGSSPKEYREPKVTTSNPISELACTSNQRNGKINVRNQDSHLLLRKSPKAPSQSSFAKSSSSCSDFEGIALSTSSLLAASYCFACLLQSDYLSLVNLITAILVIVACFVLYHVLAAE